jgi:hypothetical protein
MTSIVYDYAAIRSRMSSAEPAEPPQPSLTRADLRLLHFMARRLPRSYGRLRDFLPGPSRSRPGRNAAAGGKGGRSGS